MSCADDVEMIWKKTKNVTFVMKQINSFVMNVDMYLKNKFIFNA